jgi:hypothetical protein
VQCTTRIRFASSDRLVRSAAADRAGRGGAVEAGGRAADPRRGSVRLARSAQCGLHSRHDRHQFREGGDLADGFTGRTRCCVALSRFAWAWPLASFRASRGPPPGSRNSRTSGLERTSFSLTNTKSFGTLPGWTIRLEFPQEDAANVLLICDSAPENPSVDSLILTKL